MNSRFLRHFFREGSQTLGLRNRTCGRIYMKPRFIQTSSFVLDGKSVVPQHPVTTSIIEHELPPPTKVDLRLVQLLETLSLVDFADKEGIAVLEAAISLADKLTVVDTKGVEPMITVLEDRYLQLGEDEASEEDLSEDVLDCAETLEYPYFVVPPGNITYTHETTYHTDLKDEQ